MILRLVCALFSLCVVMLTLLVSLARADASESAHLLTYVSYRGGDVAVVQTYPQDPAQTQTILASSETTLGPLVWSPSQLVFALQERQGFRPVEMSLRLWNGAHLPLAAHQRRTMMADWMIWSPSGGKMLLHLPGSNGLMLNPQPILSAGRWLSFQQVTAASWSPDESWIAYTASQSWTRQSLQLIRPDGTDERTLTQHIMPDQMTPAWSPDGSRILFRRRIVGAEGQINFVLHDIRPDGTDERPLTATTLTAIDASYSPDGAWIAFHELDSLDGQSTISVIPSEGGSPTRLVDGMRMVSTPRWSPDGESIIFIGTSSAGQTDIYQLQMAQDAAQPVLQHITNDAAREAEFSWSPNYARDWQPETALAAVLLCIACFAVLL